MKYVFLILRNNTVVHVCDSEDLAISWAKLLKSKYPEFVFSTDKRAVWTLEDVKFLDISKS